MKETYWDSHDLLVNVTDEIQAVKQAYGIPHLDHVPDHELTPARMAGHGDLVKLRNGAVGIVLDVMEEYAQTVLAIVVNSGRVITKRVR
jgi:hypothetical protein